MNDRKEQIMKLAAAQPKVSWSFLVKSCGMKAATTQQYLSELTKEEKLVRVGRGEYALPKKQIFSYAPSEEARGIYIEQKAGLPFTDFCVYDGSILSSIQHHLSINHAIYVETNRDAVEYVFSSLRRNRKDVYRQPNADFVNDYIDLRDSCVIVKPLVTESPLTEADGVRVPTLEKILVDTQKDPDFDYLRGSESQNMYQQAFDLYTINTQKLMRYAKRRGISEKIQQLINQVKDHD